MNARVHRNLTMEWAKEVGFPAEVAELIGQADQAVDLLNLPRNRYHMRPALLLGRDRRGQTAAHHLREARAAAARGDQAAVWRHLGYGLHALQDGFAHGPWWLLGIHWFRWLDDPERTLWGRPDREHRRLAQLAQLTKEYLQQAWEDEHIRRCAGDSRRGAES